MNRSRREAFHHLLQQARCIAIAGRAAQPAGRPEAYILGLAVRDIRGEQHALVRVQCKAESRKEQHFAAFQRVACAGLHRSGKRPAPVRKIDFV